MAKLGLPYLHIYFKEQGISVLGRSLRGIVALVLQDKAIEGHFEIVTPSDIPKGLEERNREQIELAMMGNTNTPRKIIAVVEQSETADTPKFDLSSEGFEYLETVRWDYLAIPFIDSTDAQKVATWVKALNDNKDKRCKVVLPNVAANHKKIINYTTETVATENKEYSTTEYTSRVAGFIAGTSPLISTTYGVFPELVRCSYATRSDIEERIGNGEFVLFNDGEKIKVGRGVNSLTETSQVHGESMRKIKIVEIMDIIADDIQKGAEDQYLGKYANSLENKQLLISAIWGYLDGLVKDGLIERDTVQVEIDVEAQRAFLKSMGYKTMDGRTVDDMEIEEIKKANTKDKVFLRAYCKILDAIEEIDLEVII